MAGQVEGIKKMVEECRYCIDIVTQLRAVQSAAKAVEANILRCHLQCCVKDAFASESKDEIETKINELMKVFGKLD